WQTIQIPLGMDEDFDTKDLRGARFGGADLSHLNLAGRRVLRTDFRGATVQADQVRTMKGWPLGWYDPPLLKALNLPDRHEANMEKNKFDGYKLDGADLSDVSLRAWSFRGANLSHADLSGADLSEADLEGSDLADAHASRQPNLLKANFRAAHNLASTSAVRSDVDHQSRFSVRAGAARRLCLYGRHSVHYLYVL